MDKNDVVDNGAVLGSCQIVKWHRKCPVAPDTSSIVDVHDPKRQTSLSVDEEDRILMDADNVIVAYWPKICELTITWANTDVSNRPS